MQSTHESPSIVTYDPVCGRRLTEAQALLSADRDGRRYLFCSERCRMLFALHPDAFAVDEGRPEADEGFEG